MQAILMSMMTPTTFSKTSGMRSRKSSNADEALEPHALSRHVRSMSVTELTKEFGIDESNLTSLRRKGVLRRLGVSKYLVDYHRLPCSLKVRFPNFSPILNKDRQHDTSYDRTANVNHPEQTKKDVFYGLEELYRCCGDQIEEGVNIIGVADSHNAEVVAGKFLLKGLGRNERTALVSFEQPDRLLARMANSGIDLDEALQNEQLIYLYYKPDIAHSISLSNNYMEFFSEVVRLGGEDVSRIVLLNVEALINCNSEYLVNASLHQFLYAVNHFSLTALGLFVSSGQVGNRLDHGCRTVLSEYLVLA